MMRYGKTSSCLPALLLLSLCLSVACDGKRSPYNSAGKSREMVMVLPAGPAGKAMKEEVRAIFGKPIPFLPQPEPEIDPVFVEHDAFRGIFKAYRHILIMETDPAKYTSPLLKITHDVWASGQDVFMAQAPDSTGLRQLLERQWKLIVTRVVHSDISRELTDLKVTYNSAFTKELEKQFPPFTMNIPTDLEWTKSKPGFLWASNLGKDNRGRLDICVYSFPYKDSRVFSPDSLVAIRDSVMRANIPGEYKDSYMTTEKRFGEAYRSYTLAGEFRAELRGFWSMVGDAMGGPFVQHYLLSPDHKTVMVAETYVYAPQLNAKKRLLLRGEAALYTLRPAGTELDPQGVFGKAPAKAKQAADKK